MKQVVRNSRDLEVAIFKLKAQKRNDFSVLITQLDQSYKELRPSRLVKRLFTDLKKEPQIKGNLKEVFYSLIGGYYSKRLLVGKSNTLLKKIIGYFVQIGASKIISNKINN